MTAFSRRAASAPVAVLHAYSFSSVSVRPVRAALTAACAHAIVDRLAMRRLIVEPPEVEDADAAVLNVFASVERALEQLVLLLEGEVGAELRDSSG